MERKKKAKKLCEGRPTVITEEVLAKLEEAFLLGYSDAEACYRAGICKATLYNYQEKNPAFIERKEQMKKKLISDSRAIVSRAIEKGNLKVAQWYLERKAKEEFSLKTENAILIPEKPQIIDDIPDEQPPNPNAPNAT